MTRKYAQTAAEAVGDRLKIEDFIDRHFNQILDNLQESAEKSSNKENTSFNETFIQAALPIIDSVIHVGSSRDNYMEAQKWAQKSSQEMRLEPVRWLTLLTFLHIILMACAKRPERSIWERIENAVEGLLDSEVSGAS